jgi:hypothetical protein
MSDDSPKLSPKASRAQSLLRLGSKAHTHDVYDDEESLLDTAKKVAHKAREK